MQTAEKPEFETLERRSEPRKKALMHAFVSDFEGHVDLKCVIREISRGGCRIASSYVEDLPRTIRICPEGFEKPLVGKVVWRKAKFAGIKFITEAEAEADALARAARRDDRQAVEQGFLAKLVSFATLRRKSGHAGKGDERAGAHLPTYSSRALNAVRQPIAAIRSLLGLLMGDAVQSIPRRAKSVIGAAQKNATQAETLLNDALRTDNVEAGHIRCRIEPVEIVELVQDAALMSSGHAAQYDVRLDVADNIGRAMIEGDPARLQEVVRNLLLVAARFSPVKETIIIGLQRKGGRIRVSVSDKGTGTSVLYGDADGKHVNRDTEDELDLELDVARAILLQHKSNLHLETGAGQGTVAWFELPELPA